MHILLAILNVLLIALSILLIIIAVILVVPFEYSFEAENKDEFNAEAKIYWMLRFFKIRIFRKNGENKFSFNIVNKQIIVKKLDYHKKDKKYKDNDNKQKEKSKAKTSIKEYLDKKFFKDVWEYLKDIIEIIKPSVFKIHGSYGFEDPSITGLLCGAIPLIVKFIPNGDIRLEPVFYGEILEVEVEISGRIILAVVVYKTIRLIFKESIRKKIFKKRKKVETY